jgi:hypothetical protein
MTADDAVKLQQRNAAQMRQMDIDAAGMIQSLLLDLGSNGTFISLQSPQLFTVGYTLVEGTGAFVQEIGGQLGLSVTDSTIEVPHA